MPVTQSTSSPGTTNWTEIPVFCVLPRPDFRDVIVNCRLDLHLMSLCSES